TFPDYGIKHYPKVGKRYSHVTYYVYQDEKAFEQIGTVLNAYADSTNIGDSDAVYLSVKNWKTGDSIRGQMWIIKMTDENWTDLQDQKKWIPQTIAGRLASLNPDYSPSPSLPTP